MCSMISGLFIGSNDGRPPQAYKENLVSLITILPVHSFTGMDRNGPNFRNGLPDGP